MWIRIRNIAFYMSSDLLTSADETQEEMTQQSGQVTQNLQERPRFTYDRRAVRYYGQTPVPLIQNRRRIVY
jgi:hypothetical protein